MYSTQQLELKIEFSIGTPLLPESEIGIVMHRTPSLAFIFVVLATYSVG